LSLNIREARRRRSSQRSHRKYHHQSPCIYRTLRHPVRLCPRYVWLLNHSLCQPRSDHAISIITAISETCQSNLSAIHLPNAYFPMDKMPNLHHRNIFYPLRISRPHHLLRLKITSQMKYPCERDGTRSIAWQQSHIRTFGTALGRA